VVVLLLVLVLALVFVLGLLLMLYMDVRVGTGGGVCVVVDGVDGCLGVDDGVCVCNDCCVLLCVGMGGIGLMLNKGGVRNDDDGIVSSVGVVASDDDGGVVIGVDAAVMVGVVVCVNVFGFVDVDVVV